MSREFSRIKKEPPEYSFGAHDRILEGQRRARSQSQSSEPRPTLPPRTINIHINPSPGTPRPAERAEPFSSSVSVENKELYSTGRYSDSGAFIEFSADLESSPDNYIASS